jgi:hypothetical protein
VRHETHIQEILVGVEYFEVFLVQGHLHEWVKHELLSQVIEVSLDLK